jgi:hypothetical protein
MPLLDLVCIGCCEMVFEAVELGFEDAVGNGRLDVFGDAVGKGRLDVFGDAVGNGRLDVSRGRFSVLDNDGVALDVKIEGSLSYIGIKERSVGIGSWDGNSDCGGLLDKGDEHCGVGEMLLSKGSEAEI